MLNVRGRAVEELWFKVCVLIIKCWYYLKCLWLVFLINKTYMFQNMKFKDFNDNATRWLRILIFYICILHNDLMRGHVDLMMLRSTTGSYGRPVIEVAYGEILFHSTEAVWELLAWEEWLGCRHDTSLMFDIPESTPVWVQYILFFSFYDIKIYIHIMF